MTALYRSAAIAAVLTPREQEVRALLIEGLSNKAIAARLGLSPRTVEVHRAHVLKKLGAARAADLGGMRHGPEIAAPRAVPPANHTPRIGVLPAQGVGLSPAEIALGVRLAEEIASSFPRYRELSVVSPRALARYTGDTVSALRMRRELEIDFIVDGTLQRERGKLRITLRLADLRDGDRIVWSRRYDQEAADPMTGLDTIAAAALAQIPIEIQAIEAKRAAGGEEEEASARDLLLRAETAMTRLDRAGFMRAGAWLSRAIAREPDFAAAHATYSFWHLLLFAQDWALDLEGAAARTGELAERAVALDPADARVVATAGHAMSFLGSGPRAASALIDRALELNPDLPQAWAYAALTRSFMGEPDEAERRINKYKLLSPHDPWAYYFDFFCTTINLQKRDYHAAVISGRQSTQLNPLFTVGYLPYLAALGHLGMTREANAVLGRFRSGLPRFGVSRYRRHTRFERVEDRDHYADGLQRAGLPD